MKVGDVSLKEMYERVAIDFMGWVRSSEPIPKCPACGVSCDVQKCPFDQGGDCARHDVWREWKASQKPPNYNLAEEARAVWNRMIEKGYEPTLRSMAKDSHYVRLRTDDHYHPYSEPSETIEQAIIMAAYRTLRNT
jgi:hypothetical protein